MKQILLIVLSFFATGSLFAQDGETKKVNIDVNVGDGADSWYGSPWVWVVGAMVLILLLVALTRGNRRAD